MGYEHPFQQPSVLGGLRADILMHNPFVPLGVFVADQSKHLVIKGSFVADVIAIRGKSIPEILLCIQNHIGMDQQMIIRLSARPLNAERAIVPKIAPGILPKLSWDVRQCFADNLFGGIRGAGIANNPMGYEWFD